MKLNGIQIEEHGSGYAVTLRLHVPHVHVNDDEMTSEEVEFFEDLGVRTLTTTASFACERGEVVSRDTEGGDPRPTDAPPATESSAGTGGRRGRRAAQAAATEKSAEEEPSAEDPTDAPAAGAGRRGRRAQNAAAKSPSEGDPTGAAAAGGPRRGRRARAAAGSDQDGSSAPDAGGGETRKGRRASEGKAAASPSSKVTDEDLTKAASQSAPVIGAEGVMEVLSQFKGATKLNDLKAGQRQKFLDALKQAKKEAE
jgi:hypothetical protein|tara:strand:- start:2866 stop:3630 length:765 start_codon:yes stop_codon:yes gene_type:complete